MKGVSTELQRLHYSSKTPWRREERRVSSQTVPVDVVTTQLTRTLFWKLEQELKLSGNVYVFVSLESYLMQELL